MSSTFGDAPCAGAANGIARPGKAWLGWPTAGYPCPGYPTRGHLSASASNTQGGSRMRESRTYGSVRGALSDGRPYRDPGGPFVSSGHGVGKGGGDSTDATSRSTLAPAAMVLHLGPHS